MIFSLCRHIYFPLGGSRYGIVRQLIATMICYIFVFVWHGLTLSLFIWAALNFLDIVIEAITKLVSVWPAFIKFEVWMCFQITSQTFRFDNYYASKALNSLRSHFSWARSFFHCVSKFNASAGEQNYVWKLATDLNPKQRDFSITNFYSMMFLLSFLLKNISEQVHTCTMGKETESVILDSCANDEFLVIFHFLCWFRSW